MTLKTKNNSGFTIVELLVVIVIVGILAAITIVSYVGIAQKANEAAFISDLSNAKKQISLYFTEHGVYPTSLQDGTNCLTNDTLTPLTDTNYCLRSGSGNVFSLSNVTATTYLLTASKGTVAFEVTESKAPYNSIKTPIVAIGAITGIAQVSQTLTAGSVTPADATVSYQWQGSRTVDGTYINIPGATGSTYTLNPSNINKYLKVVVTGIGGYNNTKTSTASTQIATDSNWIVAGDQIWAAANLNVGTMIASAVAQTNNGGTDVVEKYCYDDSVLNCETYGGLYQWGEAMKYSNIEGSQGICPVGSHIPSNDEWKALEVSLGMTQEQSVLENVWRGTDQGTKLKIGGVSGLNMPIAGLRDINGTFGYVSWYAYLWSSSESNTNAWGRGLGEIKANVYGFTNDKSYGFSLRCLAN